MLRPFLNALILAIALVAMWAAIANAGTVPSTTGHATGTDPAVSPGGFAPAASDAPAKARPAADWGVVGMGWG